ncbi:MAG: hypothetical protein H0T47_17080 [Planctomycetaceae bacterium]|nr:hypothetical protein [Planctomycetaceae bacterium]
MSDANIALSDALDETRSPLTFSLEIRGGRTGYRRRPILGDRFLIGSDAVCDLRLDGRLAAPLHCLLRRDGDHLEAERLCDVEMTVNGRSVESATLVAGDTLGVGGVRLIVHSVAVRFDVIRPADGLDSPHFDRSGFQSGSVSERPAAHLVELIERENDRIRDFEDRQRAGAAALLEAVRRSRRPSSGAVAEEATNSSLDAIVKRLDQLAGVLERQSEQHIVPGDHPREAASTLIAAQQEVLDRLTRLARLAAAFTDLSRDSSRRAA